MPRSKCSGKSWGSLGLSAARSRGQRRQRLVTEPEPVGQRGGGAVVQCQRRVRLERGGRRVLGPWKPSRYAGKVSRLRDGPEALPAVTAGLGDDQHGAVDRQRAAVRERRCPEAAGSLHQGDLAGRPLASRGEQVLGHPVQGLSGRGEDLRADRHALRSTRPGRPGATLLSSPAETRATGPRLLVSAEGVHREQRGADHRWPVDDADLDLRRLRAHLATTEPCSSGSRAAAPRRRAPAQRAGRAGAGGAAATVARSTTSSAIRSTTAPDTSSPAPATANSTGASSCSRAAGRSPR